MSKIDTILTLIAQKHLGIEKDRIKLLLGSGSDLLTALSSFDGVVVSIGDGRARLDRQLRLAEAGARIVTLIHPAATVSRHAFLDTGTVVMAGAVVNSARIRQ